MEKVIEFKTKLLPFDGAKKLVNANNSESDLLYKEYYDLGDGKQMCTLVFERYFFRTGGRGSLTIILENVSGPNKVKCIPAGSAEGILNIDWGASKDFVRWVENALSAYTLEEPQR
ncbi:DUF6054 family protein [Priestia megaterium]|uniref:DUF6054 family protein n=1 Tax=Priestia megaterium TaxID=1404 RepID=UPI0021F4E1FA|nr:DUF6054 family protein [Priestia megaterium]UYP09655.1 DUF6054 family protein [Priestia megaterium]